MSQIKPSYSEWSGYWHDVTPTALLCRSVYCVNSKNSSPTGGIVDILTLTIEEYRARSPFGRFMYRLYRNPLLVP